MDSDAPDAGVRPCRLAAREDIRNRLPHSAVAEVQSHAADFGFVNDVWRKDFATTVDPSASRGAATPAASSASRASSAGVTGME